MDSPGVDREMSCVRIDMLLVGDLPVGGWVLTFLDTAREVLTPERASQIADALQAVDQVLLGATDIDHLFQDLIDREPQLRAHLRDPGPGQSEED